MGNAKARRRIAQNDVVDLDTVEDAQCTLRAAWQRTSHPTCNLLHEIVWDGTTTTTTPWSSSSQDSRRKRTTGSRQPKRFRILGNGFWRDVWLLLLQQQHHHDDGGSVDTERVILKTMRYGHSYTPRNFDRMRRDSITMERLTASQYMINLYSFCGTSSVTEFGDGGDIPDALWPDATTSKRYNTNHSTLSQMEKLRIGQCA